MARPSRLDKAAMVALRDYMALAQDETLLIITDENLRDIGMALYDAGKQLCDEAIFMEMKARKINGEEPPEPIAQLMQQVDVVVCPTTKSITHTNARREASKLGVRVATMPGITLETMIRCMSADYEKIIELTNLLTERMIKVKNVRIVTESGTDVILPIKGRRIIPSTGVLRNIGESGNLPSGEVYCAPWEYKTEGVIVFDGSFAGIGLLKEPIRVEIREGFATSVTGGKQAEKLLELFEASGKYSRAVAEFGVGTNYKARLCGEILEDEKVLGTVHVAFGNNISMGGRISVNSHLDGIINEPNVFFDDDLVMMKGKLSF